MQCIDGVKGLAEVSWSQPKVKWFRNAIQLLAVIRGQPEGYAKKCVEPSNVPNATEHYAAVGVLVYITKIMESVCLSGYAFRRALRYRAASWRGGRGQAHEIGGHIFEETPPGVKCHPGVNLP